MICIGRYVGIRGVYIGWGCDFMLDGLGPYVHFSSIELY